MKIVSNGENGNCSEYNMMFYKTRPIELKCKVGSWIYLEDNSGVIGKGHTEGQANTNTAFGSFSHI